MKIELFLPGRVYSLNERQRTHRMALRRRDKAQQEVWVAVFNTKVPEAALAFEGHAQRLLTLTAHIRRARRLDKDNLTGGLKPMIDILRCRRLKGITVHHGFVWDDNPKYMDLEVHQVLLKKTDPVSAEGVLIEMDTGRHVHKDVHLKADSPYECCSCGAVRRKFFLGGPEEWHVCDDCRR